jgi:hypothetical protein
MNKQTSLQWFLDKLPHSIETQFSKQIQQAMQMEREQMEKAVSNAISKADMIDNRGYFNFDKWYNETYGVKGRENKTVVEEDKVIKVEPKLGEWGDYI